MKTIALYPGSFNPFHIGHLNILYKAEKIFGKDNVVVAIGINPNKDKRTEDEIIKACDDLENKITRPVVYYYGLFLHEVIQNYEQEGYNVVIIRGLRNGTDLDYEVNQMRYITDFKKDVNVVYITCDKEYEHISSSAIRSLEQFRKGSSDQYLV